MSKDYYAADLAYIHDVGFCHHVRRMTQAILPLLGEATKEKLVVDLGCGSGVSAHALAKAGFKTLGIDYSAEMIALARARDKQTTYRQGSFLEAEIPECHAALAIGEVINYLFDPNNKKTSLNAFFRKVFKALRPGGWFILDFAEPGRHTASKQSFVEGDDWACVAKYEHDKSRQTLTRQIVSFRKVGRSYRRAEETHVQRLYKASEIAGSLRKIGHKARVVRKLPNYQLPHGVAAVFARKPA